MGEQLLRSGRAAEVAAALFGNGGFYCWMLRHLGWVQLLLEAAAVKVSVVGGGGGGCNVSGFIHRRKQRMWQWMICSLAEVVGGGFISFVGGGRGYGNAFFGHGGGGISVRRRLLLSEVAASPSGMGGEVSVVGGGGGFGNGL